jgi:uncharacterized protein YwgA
MTDIDRLAVITAIAKECAGLGRTALMKYCYFLQTLRGVPLGYRFSLYSYGPFDSDVLNDLGTVESLGAVTSTIEYFSGGYGYRIEPGAKANRVLELGQKFVSAYQGDLHWLRDQFGGWSPGELELASTLIYSDREAEERGKSLTIEQLAKRVNELKPRYQLSKIEELANQLHDSGFLKSIGGSYLHAG